MLLVRALIGLAVLVAIAAASTPARGDITTGLVGHWKLNEVSGTTAADASGFNRTGTYTNSPTLNQTGQSARAVSFDGTNDYITIGDNAAFSTHATTGQTVAGWVRVTASPSALMIRAPIAAKGTTNAFEWALFVNRSSDTAWYAGASYWQSTGASYCEIGSPTTHALGTWVHVAMTCQPGGAVHLYVDGVLVQSSSSFAGSPFDGNRPVQMGRREDNTQYLNAQLDDVRIYNRVLSADDIRELYGFKLHWKLDEAAGTTVADASPYELSGTVAGTSTWTSGRRRGAIALSGGGKIAANSLLGQPGNFTIAAWVKTDAVGAMGGVAVSVGDHIAIIMDEPSSNGGKPAVAFTYSGTNFRWAGGGTSAVGKGWRHYVGVFDDAANSLKLYIDGVLVSNQTVFDSVNWATGIGTTTAVGGTSYPIAQYNLTGSVDDVRVYGYALTEAQIAEVYGLLAQYKLDENSGTTADDAGLAANDATLTGTQGWIYSVENNGHNFAHAGGEDYFTAPTNTALDDVQEDDYTIMTYFKPNSLPPGAGANNVASYGLVRKVGNNLGLIYTSTGQFVMEHFTTGPTKRTASSGTRTYLPGRYYHIAGVVNRSAGNVKLYVDGTLVATTAFTANTAAWEFNASPWRVGVSAPGGGDYGHPCDGVLDDVRIYNRALTDDELANFVNPGLQGHWNFDEGSGTALLDSSGRSRPAAFNTGTPARVTAIRTNGLSFSGSNDADTDTAFDPPPVGTVAFWFRPNSVAVGETYLLGTSSTWRVSRAASGVLRFDLGAGTGAVTSEAFNNTNKWRHLVALYNSVNDSYTIYIDGVQTGAGVLAANDVGAAILSMGTQTGSTSRVNGEIDDLRIYSYEISPSQIAELFGLTGHWEFDEGSGTTLADSSAAGNTATFNNGTPTYVDGPQRKALWFDGYSDAITGRTVQPPVAGTFAFWVSSPSLPASNRRLTGLGGDWEVRFYPDGNLYFDINGDSPLGALTQVPMQHDSRWYHVAHVFDSSDDTFATYVNGQVKASGVAAVNLVQQPAGKLSFGTRTGTVERFTGGLDDVRIYNRKLSHAEIAELYGLIGHWNLDEPSGTVAADSSGYGQHGVIHGSPAMAATGPRQSLVSMGFDGVDDFISLPTYEDSFVNGASISIWARPTASPNFAKFAYFGAGQLDSIDLGRDDTSAALRGIAEDNSSYQVGNGIMLNTWRHYVMTVDHTGLIKLYRNGVILGSALRSPPVKSIRNANYIGESGWINDGYFKGSMRDVRLYARPLMDSEIGELYRGGMPAGVRIVKWVEVQ